MTIDKEARKNKVLEVLVKAHVETAFPIGSKHIAEILGLSSATIRMVMFELEKAGLVKQPHTSAGRIPTDLGYRRYVDNMMSVKKMPNDSVFSKVKRYLNSKRFFEEIIEAASHAISELTSYTGMALSPGNKLYFDGAYHMLEQPEFQELEMVKDFLRVIEEKDELMKIMSKNLTIKGTAIYIGRENSYEELRECTIITSTYRFKENISGNIGLIGPMRMKYEEIIPIVEEFAEITTQLLEGIDV